MEDLIVNFADPRERQNLMRALARLTGMQRIIVKAYRKSRSNQANRYYWGVVLSAFVTFRHEQGEEFTAEMAHEFFKLKFLRRTVVNHDTGEVLGTTTPSTTTLDTAEFGEYLEKIIAWCADYGIHVPSPDTYALT